MRSGFIQKRCPKCGGNIYLDKDYYGWYEQCLQCSHTRYLETIVEGTGASQQQRQSWASWGKRPVKLTEVRTMETVQPILALAFKAVAMAMAALTIAFVALELVPVKLYAIFLAIGVFTLATASIMEHKVKT